MVLLSMIRHLGFDLPVLFHKEPFVQSKYEFANSIISRWNLVVYDYAPQTTAVFNHNNETEIVNFYQTGPNQRSWLPTGIRKPKEGEPFICGFKDIYNKPFGNYSFPWNLVFIGHKDSDVDPILGSVPVQQDIRRTEGGPDYAYPLRHFTDEDIWEYTKRFMVPFNSRRYDESNEFKEFENTDYNNDYLTACVKCMDNTEEKVVKCPMLGYDITNISDQVRTVNLKDFPSYIPIGGR
jgi:hypothetical protein